MKRSRDAVAVLECMPRGGRRRTVALLATLALFALCDGVAAGDREEADPAKAETPNVQNVQSETLRVFVSEKSNKYWLGVQFEPVDDLVKAQLEIEQGLAAKLIVPGGPAAAGGLEQYDILLAFNGQAVKSVEQLMELVEQAGGKEVPLRILRGGSRRMLTITPAERPARYAVVDAVPRSADFNELFKDLPGGGARWLDDNRLRMLFVKPGVILPGDALRSEAFPEKLNINVNKQGRDPARVSVEYGGERWEVAEGELDKLPEEIREHVRQFVDGPKQLNVRVLRSPAAAPDVDVDGNSAPKKREGVEIERKVRVLRDIQGLDIERLNELRRKAREQGEAVERPRTGARGDLEEVKQELRRLRREMEMLKKQVTGEVEPAEAAADGVKPQ